MTGSEDADAYFASRLEHDPKRAVLWDTLWTSVFRHLVPPDGTVVELGAGWCDFINAAEAKRRIAVDVWPGVVDHVAGGVEAHVGSAADLTFLDDSSVDVVFASNLLEHLVLDDARRLVREARRVLRPGGRLILLQPNFRLCAKHYFDDYTHVSVWTDVGLTDFLRSEQLTVERVEPRFLPLTVKSRLPVNATLIKAYLKSPIRPRAGQMLVVATAPSAP